MKNFLACKCSGPKSEDDLKQKPKHPLFTAYFEFGRLLKLLRK
jgi:hypothetical protein